MFSGCLDNRPFSVWGATLDRRRAVCVSNAGEFGLSEASRHFREKLEKGASLRAIVAKLKSQLNDPYEFPQEDGEQNDIQNCFVVSRLCQDIVWCQLVCSVQLFTF